MQDRFEDRLRRALLEREQLSEQMPRQGHEERFEIRLLRQQAGVKVRNFPRWPFIALAAASVVGAILFIVVTEIRKTNSRAEMARLSDVSAEMAAVEEFYTEKLAAGSKDFNANDRNILRFMSDIKRLEGEYKNLEENLGRNFNNERIVQAMVQNYKYRLQLLEQLQQYIEFQNKINTQINEQKTSS